MIGRAACSTTTGRRQAAGPGRLWQPHNLYRVDPSGTARTSSSPPTSCCGTASRTLHDMLHMCFGTAMGMLAKTLRNMIIAEEGKTLKGCDLANIEGRLAAWFGGEDWKLEAFRAYDEKRGPDLYCVAYGAAFGEDPALVKANKFKRQIGKVMELALGYQGSVGSFISMGKNYGLRPGDLIATIKSVSPDQFAMWCDRYAKATDKHKLPIEEWAAVKTIVTGWRDGHPGIVKGWWTCRTRPLRPSAILAPSSTRSTAALPTRPRGASCGAGCPAVGCWPTASRASSSSARCGSRRTAASASAEQDVTPVECVSSVHHTPGAGAVAAPRGLRRI